MRVFVTGASGFIGSATVRELLKNKHTVLGLSRSPSSARKLTDLGAEVHHGSLEDLESLKSGAAQCDGVIHLGFVMNFADFAGSCATDRAAVEAMGSALTGTGKPLVVTSGILMLKAGELGTEDDKPSTEGMAAVRGVNEAVALGLAEKGVRSMVIRLPPTVHGEGDKGFVPMIGAAAKEKGFAPYIGEGVNRWTAVHRLDAANLYRLALEHGVARGVYHGVAEESVPVKEISEAVGKALKAPVESKSFEEAVGLLGFLAYALASDSPASSAKTRAELGWKPEQPGLIADVEKTYFK